MKILTFMPYSGECQLPRNRSSLHHIKVGVTLPIRLLNGPKHTQNFIHTVDEDEESFFPILMVRSLGGRGVGGGGGGSGRCSPQQVITLYIACCFVRCMLFCMLRELAPVPLHYHSGWSDLRFSVLYDLPGS